MSCKSIDLIDPLRKNCCYCKLQQRSSENEIYLNEKIGQSSSFSQRSLAAVATSETNVISVPL
jgi:hypothetical protein